MQQYPQVKGMSKSLFFWSHDHGEGGQGFDEGRSKYNAYEVDAAVALARWVATWQAKPWSLNHALRMSA